METNLTRRQERLFAELKARHGRRKSEFCVCEGLRCCEELFRSPAVNLLELVAAASGAADKLVLPPAVLSRLVTIDEKRLQQLASTVNSQGILALVRRPESPPATLPVPDSFILALDKLGDPGNFGTILRTVRAAGLHELWFTAGSVDPYGAKAIRSGLAAQFSLTLREFADLDALAERAAKLGYPTVYLTDPHCGESCFICEALFAHSVIVIGSEAHGVGAAAAGRRVTIPMPGGFESLNAAQAATIVLFEHVRRGGVGRSEG